MKKKLRERGFTLSEVIITLVVIGIVAAITVPMLSNSASDKKWNVARQKAKATIGEAFRLMTVNGEITTTNPDGTTRTTEQMVTKILPKYLKLEKTCAPANYGDCGFPATVKTPSGGSIGVTPNNYKWSELSQAIVWKASPTSADKWGVVIAFTSLYGNTYDTSYYFRTLDGFSVAFLYNPYCVSDTKERYTYFSIVSNNKYVYQHSLDAVCFNAIYDMNGKKGPNKIGYDIGFIGSFYNGFNSTTAAVLPHSEEKKAGQIGATTGSNSWQKLYNYCDNLGNDKEWIMPDIDETSLIYLNYRLVANVTNVMRWFFSRSPLLGAPTHARSSDFFTSRGTRCFDSRSYSSSYGPYVRCVRRTQLK